MTINTGHIGFCVKNQESHKRTDGRLRLSQPKNCDNIQQYEKVFSKYKETVKKRTSSNIFLNIKFMKSNSFCFVNCSMREGHKVSQRFRAGGRQVGNIVEKK